MFHLLVGSIILFPSLHGSGGCLAFISLVTGVLTLSFIRAFRFIECLSQRESVIFFDNLLLGFLLNSSFRLSTSFRTDGAFGALGCLGGLILSAHFGFNRLSVGGASELRSID